MVSSFHCSYSLCFIYPVIKIIKNSNQIIKTNNQVIIVIMKICPRFVDVGSRSSCIDKVT